MVSTSTTTPPLDAPGVLIVDDTPANLLVLSRMLKAHGYRARPVPGGALALDAARAAPPDIILLDISMPDMDGFEVCRRLKADEALRDIPVIFISAHTDTEGKVRAFAAGGVDYITKPFQIEEVNARVGAHLKIRGLQRELEEHNRRLEVRVREQGDEILNSHLATLFALATLAESRDSDTGAHLPRVRSFCSLLANRLAQAGPHRERMTADFIRNLEHACPLHDIGKVAIRDEILMKPGPLTPAEFATMKMHTIHGATTLETVRRLHPGNELLGMAIAIARHHHERWDGKGYPDGLARHGIPIEARIVAVADNYDALRSPRCYKAPFGEEVVSNMLDLASGKQFDPDVVEAFRAVRADFSAVWDRKR